ncbi:MAG: pyridoxamine 5'-phosphate oxidase family protein [Proteobacteria bacterium]|nr:pyridoxamine 5'-phosphate oxidase family protein [Pseudomonadota bacterium]
MAILSADMKRVITEQRLGFVATVNADGTPNLSPKGTMMVRDDDSIMFAEIRSPGTVANLQRNPAAEINFVDPISRKGYRFKGRLRMVSPGDGEYDELFENFAGWGALAEKVNGVVIFDVERAEALTSPAYDIGVTEQDLRQKWLDHYQAIQP